MTELPSTWAVVELGDLLTELEDGRTLHQGWSPQCERLPATTEDDWAVLKTTAIQPGWFDATQNKRLPDALHPRPALEVRAGDVLITCAGPRRRCGVPCRVRQTRPRLMISGKMYRFRVSEQVIDSRYLEAYLLSSTAQADIDRLKTGGSDSGLNLTQGRFRRLRVPLPPRSEQSRIVEIVDQHCSLLKSAGAAVRSASLRLRRYREAVLTALIDPEWQSIPLRELAESTLIGIDRSRAQQRSVPPGSPYLRMNGITTEGTVEWSDITYVDVTSEEEDRFSIRRGDLLFNTRNSRELVGKTGLAVSPPPGAVFNNNIMRIRSKADVLPAYLVAVMTTPHFRRQLDAVKKGTTNVAAVYAKDLLPLPVPVPPLEVQRAVTAEVDRQISIANALRESIDNSARRAAALHRSVLAAAVSGRLVAQDGMEDRSTEVPAPVARDRRDERKIRSRHRP